MTSRHLTQIEISKPRIQRCEPRERERERERKSGEGAERVRAQFSERNIMERDKDLDRVKALLSSYYGNDDDGDGPGGGAAATSSRSANEAAHGASEDGALFSERASAASSSFGAGNSLDSTNFEANAFFDNLLETTHLDELLEKEVKLQGEVKTFDGEMQQLVYENYNKFISATDTIRNMRGKVSEN